MTTRKEAVYFPTTEHHVGTAGFPNLWKTLSEYRNRWYVERERFLAAFSSQKPLRILISDVPGVRGEIEWGISHYSRHSVEFGPITAESFEKYDVVVPIPIADLVEAAEWAGGRKNPLPLPSKESVELCDDKFKFNQKLIEEGFGAYIPRMGRGFQKPYMLKKRIGVCSRECHLISDMVQEYKYRRMIADPDYFCQEFVAGKLEYATHILFANDRIEKSLNIQYEFETKTPVKGKDQSLTRTICSCPYLDLFTDVLRAIQFQGLCCVNYKVADGKPYILEINPRFGGSLAPYFFSFLRHLDV